VRGRRRLGWVLAVTIAGIIGAATPGGALDHKGRVTEFSTDITFVGGSILPGGITAGPDGNLWFTWFANFIDPATGRLIDQGSGGIGRITPKGAVTKFPAGVGAFPSITAGPDGNLWFTTSGNRIGRITTKGVVTEFPLGPGILEVPAITGGPDGNVWFPEVVPDPAEPNCSNCTVTHIGRITPAGVVSHFSAGVPDNNFGITAGPDGNVWFTHLGEGIGRITPKGAVTEFPAAGRKDELGEVIGGPGYTITAGPDGNLWFTGWDAPGIGRITPDGVATQFSTGHRSAYGIAAGADGNLWFTTRTRIGRITPAGVASYFSVGLSADASPYAITAGCDGNLWFLEGGPVLRIGRIEPRPSTKSRGQHGPKPPEACRRRSRRH
jgi:streptogramin lyase